MRADLSHIKKRILSLHELGAIDFYLTKQDDWVISAVHLRRKDKKLLKESESPKVGDISIAFRHTCPDPYSGHDQWQGCLTQEVRSAFDKSCRPFLAWLQSGRILLGYV